MLKSQVVTMEVSLIGTTMKYISVILVFFTGSGFGAWGRDMYCNSRSPNWLPWGRNNQSEAVYIFGFGWSRPDAWHGIWTTDTQNHWADSGEWRLYRQFLGILVSLFWGMKLFSGMLVCHFREVGNKWKIVLVSEVWEFFTMVEVVLLSLPWLRIWAASYLFLYCYLSLQFLYAYWLM